MNRGLLGRPVGLPIRPVAAGWPPGYPLGRSQNSEPFPILSDPVTTDCPTELASQTISIPTPAAGEIVIGFASSPETDSAPTLPAGWVNVNTTSQDIFFYRICDGSEGSSFTLSLGVARRVAAIVHKVSLCLPLPPIINSRAANTSAGITLNSNLRADWYSRPALLLGLGRTTGSPTIADYALTFFSNTGATVRQVFSASRPILIDATTVATATGPTVSSYATMRFCFLSARPGGRIRRACVGWDAEVDEL